MIVNLILIFLSIGALVSVKLFPESDAGNFPTLLAWAILILSITDLAISISGKKQKTSNDTNDDEVFDNRSWIITISTLVYLLVMPYLGFIVSSGILCAIVLKAQNATSLLRALAFGFTLATIIYFVFANIMNIALPIGILN